MKNLSIISILLIILSAASCKKEKKSVIPPVHANPASTWVLNKTYKFNGTYREIFIEGGKGYLKKQLIITDSNIVISVLNDTTIEFTGQPLVRDDNGSTNEYIRYRLLYSLPGNTHLKHYFKQDSVVYLFNFVSYRDDHTLELFSH